MIITETNTVLSTIQLSKSKLLSMKGHLDSLLRKKIRLESEITVLRKQIKDKLKVSNTKIKASIHLESSETLDSEQAQELQKKFPELYDALQDFDSFELDIIELVKYYDD